MPRKISKQDFLDRLIFQSYLDQFRLFEVNPIDASAVWECIVGLLFKKK